jgi:hypothetical protein|tara:strand:+ start:663 stop:947 length:285 start_codon:yes stop_codon:yes gene_type:complete
MRNKETDTDLVYKFRNNWETYENYMLYVKVVCNIPRELILECKNSDAFKALVYEEVFVDSDASDVVNELALLFLASGKWDDLYSNSFNIAHLNE